MQRCQTERCSSSRCTGKPLLASWDSFGAVAGPTSFVIVRGTTKRRSMTQLLIKDVGSTDTLLTKKMLTQRLLTFEVSALVSCDTMTVPRAA